jgi:predicted amidohydrolase
MVVSPFGEVLGWLGGSEDLLLVDIDLDVVARARETLPVLANRRSV